MKSPQIIALILLLATTSASWAEGICEDVTFMFDENIPNIDKFAFEDLEPRLPKPGNFKLINYFLMSNGCGDRAALVTVRNTSAGTNTLAGENIVAVTSNGRKLKGVVNRRIRGFTTESFTVAFGKSSIPIITILMIEK